jgi:hypothetical protein
MVLAKAHGTMSIQSRKARRHWRRTVNKVRLTVKLTNLDSDASGVLAEVRGWGAHEWARWDQTIAGSSWETARDMPGYAYTILVNDPGLVRELRAEGYALELSEYSEPDPEAYGVAC